MQECITACVAITAVTAMEITALLNGYDGLLLSSSVGAVVAIALKKEWIHGRIKSLVRSDYRSDTSSS